MYVSSTGAPICKDVCVPQLPSCKGMERNVRMKKRLVEQRSSMWINPEMEMGTQIYVSGHSPSRP